MQMTLFSSETHPMIKELQEMSIDELTPIEAISKLYELQKRARES
jgi:DNA mismatch repair protein MutS